MVVSVGISPTIQRKSLYSEDPHKPFSFLSARAVNWIMFCRHSWLADADHVTPSHAMLQCFSNIRDFLGTSVLCQSVPWKMHSERYCSSSVTTDAPNVVKRLKVCVEWWNGLRPTTHQGYGVFFLFFLHDSDASLQRRWCNVVFHPKRGPAYKGRRVFRSPAEWILLSPRVGVHRTPKNSISVSRFIGSWAA